ncbi:MAG: hypothetical protein J1F35_03525 [Erysipelotrichales bacterium]|nr:hypothetical protein [Erysipelotrichales bacterium]
MGEYTSKYTREELEDRLKYLGEQAEDSNIKGVLVENDEIEDKVQLQWRTGENTGEDIYPITYNKCVIGASNVTAEDFLGNIETNLGTTKEDIIREIEENLEDKIVYLDTKGKIPKEYLPEIDCKCEGDNTEVSPLSNTISPIGVLVEKNENDGGVLKIYGHKPLLEAGYVPYIWRYITKTCRRWDPEAVKFKHYKRKGWQTYGSHYSVNINEDDIIEFSTNPGYKLNLKPSNYSCYASNLIKYGAKYEVGHGQRGLKLRRGIKIKFAIGFAKPKELKEKITTADLVSNLVEFYTVWSGSLGEEQWSYGLNMTL